MSMYYGYGFSLPRAVKALLIANVAVYAIAILLGRERLFFYLFGLTPALVSGKLMIWQFFTYMFLHGGLGHIGFNMFALWMFGTELEYNWGTRDFLKYYFACGIGGGIIVWITSLLGLSPYTVPTIGASGAIYGLLLAYGMMWPDRIILVFGLLPMKALHFVIIFGAVDLFQGFTRMNSGTAYFAHVGGLATGFVYLKFGWRIMVHLEHFFGHNPIADRFRGRRFTVIDGGRGKHDEGESDPAHPDIEDEVDRILDKIARNGMESLDDRERDILERASRRKR